MIWISSSVFHQVGGTQLLRGEPSAVDQSEGALKHEVPLPDWDIEEPLEEEEPLVVDDTELALEPLKVEFVPEPPSNDLVDPVDLELDFPREEEDMEEEEDHVPMNSRRRGVWEWLSDFKY